MKALLLLLSLMLAAPAMAVETNSPYQAALANPARSDKDRERDARDKPAELLGLAGIRAGMSVADLFGAGGYWSEILVRVVGAQGAVWLVNNPAYAEFARKELDTRFAGERLAAVLRSVVDPADLRLGTGTLDAALLVMSFHDLYYVDAKGGWPAIDAGGFLDQVRAALKPRGTLLIVDHAAAAGSGSSAAQSLHRIDEQFTIAQLEAHGFRLEKTYDGLRNPADDRSTLVFDPAIRGRTDRFVHVYRAN